MAYQLVIRNGTIVDGLGGEPFVGDVAVSDGADGYVATVVSGEVIAEHGAPMSARPGKLVRGRQPAPI